MAKERLDVLVAKRGLVDSREKAQRVIRAGKVRVKGQVASKPGHQFPDDSEIELESPPPFVSRGGEKLEGAFKEFDLNVEDLICMDIGASTGGFTDCLLQHGAQKVIAIDVGFGLLDLKIRNDPRVEVVEKFNARYIEPEMMDEPVHFMTIDVSFISLTKILPAVTQVLEPGGHIVSLIKPQFEAGRKQVEKGGVVKDPAIRQQVVDHIKAFGTGELDLEWLGVCTSPLKGPAGNVEFLAYWKKKPLAEATETTE